MGSVTRMPKLALWSLLAPALLAAFAACSPPPPETPRADAGPAPRGGEPLVASLQVNPAGDSVRLVLQVSNAGTAPVALTFPSGQTFDFSVSQGGREVWRWSADRSFTQVLRETSVAAGATERYEAAWRPAAGTHGAFVARGWITAQQVRAEQSTAFTLP
jgi:Intracellular proteinase inhibitor